MLGHQSRRHQEAGRLARIPDVIPPRNSAQRWRGDDRRCWSRRGRRTHWGAGMGLRCAELPSVWPGGRDGGCAKRTSRSTARSGRCRAGGPSPGNRSRCRPRRRRPRHRHWPLLFKNVTIRFLGSDDLPLESERAAVEDITGALAAGILRPTIGAVFPLSRIAEAHDRVDHGGSSGQVLIDLASMTAWPVLCGRTARAEQAPHPYQRGFGGRIASASRSNVDPAAP